MGIIKHKSFTLIELVVAVGVVGFILPTVFSIFFMIIRQQLVLVAYQDLKHQGDSVQRNIQNLLKNRATAVTLADHLTTGVCPLPLTPTPTYSPALSVAEKGGNFVDIAPLVLNEKSTTIASRSAVTEYQLSSESVSVTNFGYTCYRINTFSPEIVSVQFTMKKTTTFNDVQLPYSFNARLSSY